ncbi:MAG TPA: phosphodiesterase [Solirubrobacteraceae bacterium]|nr:phosphodiesterase [Solirubrobacteraceae bacterium]
MVLVQLADLHIGAGWVATDPLRTLAATIDSVRRLDVAVDGVLALGDLAEHGSDEEYARTRAELERLEAPLYVVMGNRDDREVLRRQFGLEPSDGAPLDYATDLGPARLVVIDTTVPGEDEDAGKLDPVSLDWLKRELADHPEQGTLLAMHHPPLLTGSPAWDRYALSETSRTGLAEVLERHPQVTQILSAHLHRPVLTQFASRPLLIGPSTYLQFPIGMQASRLDPTDEPPGFVVHFIAPGGGTISYFQTVTSGVTCDSV